MIVAVHFMHLSHIPDVEESWMMRADFVWTILVILQAQWSSQGKSMWSFRVILFRLGSIRILFEIKKTVIALHYLLTEMLFL